MGGQELLPDWEARSGPSTMQSDECKMHACLTRPGTQADSSLLMLMHCQIASAHEQNFHGDLKPCMTSCPCCQAFKRIHETMLLQGYASGLIDIGDSAVASADDISSALATIQSIVSNQIQFSTLFLETQVIS